MAQWWVIWQPDATPNYTIFQGTQDQADAKSKLTTSSKVDGPYNNKADAQNAVSSGAIQAPSSQPLGGVGAAGESVPNPFQGVADAAHAIAGVGAFFTDAWKQLTNWRMWASLGWLLLGVLLLLIGIGLWIGPSAARMSPIGLARQALS